MGMVRKTSARWQREKFASPQAAMARMAAEARAVDGPVPESLDDPWAVAPTFDITDSEYLLRLPSGVRFHYRKGQGVRIHRPEGSSDQEVKLFFDGSVYGAIAYLNGLIPLHASAVLQDGAVRAFTAKSGGGKSTLVAGLLSRDFRLFSDDVLLLDISDPEQIWCLPGHKKLKLWDDAVELTGADAGDQVRPELQKFFIDAEEISCREPAPLADLYQLDDAKQEQTGISDVAGTRRFAIVRRAMYRPRFAKALFDNLTMFETVSGISKLVRVRQFQRAMLKEHYWENLDYLIADVRGDNG